jgi:hypothetical protein
MVELDGSRRGRLVRTARLAVAALTLGVVTAASPVPRAAAADSYRALSPARILDTRSGLGAAGPVGPGGQITLDVTGVGGVPDSGVSAVVLNVTATGATQSTFVTVWPTGETKPNTSNLNVLPAVDTPNSVIATVGADGTVQLANEFGSVHLLADVSGWFAGGSEYRALTPARVLDSRNGVAATGPVGPGGEIAVDVTGAGGVPDSGVAAVVLNVTAVEATEPTYVTVWPSGEPKPGTSNLNVRPGVDTPNLVIATVGADGAVRLANQFGSVNLIADVAGYFPSGSDYRALTPHRVLDTRGSLGASGPVGAEGTISVDVTGVGGVPETGVSAVVLNVTAAEATQGTYVTVWPNNHPKPNTSNLNVLPGVDTPNLVIATVSTDGRIALGNQFGSTHLIADIAGWFPGAPSVPPPDPNSPGTLWAEGNGTIWRYQLANPSAGWQDRGQFGEAFAIDAPRNQLVDVDAFPSSPVTVQVRDLDTNQVAQEFVWPSGAWGANDVSASADGKYLAAVFEETSLDLWLELYDRTTGTARDFGFDELVREVEFAPNGDLLVLFDDSYAEANPWRSAIGIITRAELDSGNVGAIQLYPFDDAQGVASGLRVHHDGTIAFARAGALWTLSPTGTVHQMTTGPEPQSTGVISPDGTRIAFVLPSVSAFYQRQYIIPNHRGTPIYIDASNGDGGEYLLDQSNLVTAIRAWVP